ncbi:MAG: DUF5658 family protein [Phycisphaerales bacterium]|jgi:hypothetical protein|nr:DUF5658 family protein [Phycisphaerales bacterium]
MDHASIPANSTEIGHPPGSCWDDGPPVPQATTFTPWPESALAAVAAGPIGRFATRRDWRMLVALTLITIVSIADLYLTLTYLQSVGMSEGNPIARWVIAANCSWVLVAFKTILCGFSISVLWYARRRTSAEIAAWLACIVMAWLCFKWYGYTDQVADVVAAMPEITETSLWVNID